MAKKIRVWDGSAWQDVAPALPYTAIHSAQASMPATGVDGQVWLDTDGTLSDTAFVPLSTIDAKGDLLVGTADNTVSRLASSGTNDQVLTVDTSTATGLKWATPTSSSNNLSLVTSGTFGAATSNTISSLGGYSKLIMQFGWYPTGTSGTTIYLRMNGYTGAADYSVGNFQLIVGSYVEIAPNYQFQDDTYIPLVYQANYDGGIFTGHLIFEDCSTTGYTSVTGSVGYNNVAGVGGASLMQVNGILQKNEALTNITFAGGALDGLQYRIYGA